MRAGCLAVLLCALLAAAGAAAQTQPLDTSKTPSRSVLVQVEDSSELDEVGQSFGSPHPASYAVSGGTGTLTISAETHAQMRAGSGGWQATPGSFDPIVIEIALGSLEVTSQPASGQITNGQATLNFTQNALGTTVVGGFMEHPINSIPPFYCTSQQDVDDACSSSSMFCGATCVIVPGSAYAPGTGQANLIGSETQSGCDGAVCDGPFTFFTDRGDLRFSEVDGVPALSPAGSLALVVLLGGAALAMLRSKPLRRR